MIAAGYADANDCDALRADPVFKLAVGRLPESGEDLCSQPTMCRLENLPSATALKRMMAAMIGLEGGADHLRARLGVEAVMGQRPSAVEEPLQRGVGRKIRGQKPPLAAGGEQIEHGHGVDRLTQIGHPPPPERFGRR
jgi:hypothetical protein